MSQTQIGLVVGSLDVANLCFSFVVASAVSPKNIKFFYSTGMLWSSVTVGAFGILGDSPDGLIYFVSCLVCRLFNGIGAAMLYSTAMPIAVQMYPEKTGIITTVIQTSLGLGLCLGPPVGSLLVPLGGYKSPFLTVSCIELIVFLLGCAVVPARGAKTKAKVRSSEYVRYLCRFSTLSIVVPTAAIFCVAGIRDTAYSLYFENTLGLDSETVGFIFISNSVAYLITGPIVGVLVELGMGPYVDLFSHIFVPLISFGFFIPMIFPALECVPWGLLILFGNGFSLATIMNPTYLILEKVAIKQGLTNMQQIKTIIASTFNLVASSGRMFGSFVIGGYLNDKVGFYYMCLSYGIILSIGASWHILFLLKNRFIRRMYYDANVPTKNMEDRGKIRLDTTTEGEKEEENEDDDLMMKATLSNMFMNSMSRSQVLNR